MADRIAAFWKWFMKGPGKWPRPTDDMDEERQHALFDRLEHDFPSLTPEFFWTPGENYELTFSLVRNRAPDARREATPLVLSLVKAAPRAKFWRFSAFAPPIAWMDAFLPALDFPPKSRLVVGAMRYEVLAARPLALRVYVPRYSKKHHDHFVIAVERVLEAGMGEAWVLEKLKRLELADVKKAPAKARPMSELSA